MTCGSSGERWLGLLADAPADPGREDYLEIHLEDKQPIVDAMGRLRQAYPNALHLRRVALDAQTSEFKPDARPMDEAEIFRAFFEQATGEAANGEQLKVFREVLQSVRDAPAGGRSMKPLRLIMEGFGPYARSQEIDFTRLQDRPLFLIHGPHRLGQDHHP